MTAPQPAEEHAPELWTSPSAFAYVPSVPGPALRVMLFLLGVQEPGGRIVITQEDIASALGMKRSAVGLSLQHLQFARIVWKERQGVYQLNPQVAGFTTPAEAGVAIRQMDEAFYLDVEDFEERYQAAVEEHQEALKRKAAMRKMPAMPPTDLAAHRQRRSRQGRRAQTASAE
ncbi:helix-turn-helix domain-containing protein [Streptomyces sp. NBC_01142]|uniref:helix-turn-helix domain-containing protein n=1 Tax=Streptomyces sp. NBC_01142 TaxID=2975865 RepID=UPI002258FF43|nr:helix-turn-helix domain-containing protein [Streptomyces sp. NBC_01142]MCX4826421.1 helix-turn-helix domain-containing protein [Streptomyces sp. NBC_01142]